MQIDASSSKNFVLARETAHLRNSIILPLTESHRYLHSMGADYTAQTNSIITMASVLDNISGDSRALDFISTNSDISYSDKECANLRSIFKRGLTDISDIEGIFYDVIEAVDGLLSALASLLDNGKEQVRKLIIILSDFVNKLKKTMSDTALKVYMHTKLEMIIRSQQATSYNKAA